MKQETLEEKIQRVIREEVAIAPYDPNWPTLFAQEKEHLFSCIPPGLITRIEHFGSTAVPNLAAKPIIDMLIEVVDLEKIRQVVPPILEAQGYDYFWRPSFGDSTPPFYAWFIKRGDQGQRTHHLHMVEKHFDHWQRLYFRDYLIEFPEIAQQYQILKLSLSKQYNDDRIAYTQAKTEFITTITAQAQAYYIQQQKA